MNALAARRIHVSGVVQGVGFRPFVYGLAQKNNLRGWVNNTSAGVDIEIEGAPEAVSAFLHSLTTDPPPLARIESVTVTDIVPNHHTAFEIYASQNQPGAFQPVSADVALCADCERELFDPRDRRYLYPFINCTHCGPRYTIIREMPYDRPATTMADFPLCAECAREYADPLNRRFHAQPVACERCGPKLELASGKWLASLTTYHLPILSARHLLSSGAILAVKGLGGFHLACDAFNAEAVNELRRRKGRAGKPLAVMAADMATVEQLCEVNDEERALLTGREKPIVLLQRRANAGLPASIAPGVNTLGVMLPYTPLHHLLLNQTDATLSAAPAPRVLVMTSGNFSEEPIATDNADALTRLAPLADAFLLHNRAIHIRCDDSVVKVISDQPPLTTHHSPLTHFFRRSRGYAPYPVPLPFAVPPLLAVGGELKNTICVARDRSAFLSQHIGDMENVETLAAFEQTIEHLCRLFRVEPQLIAHDLHPDYASTRFASRSSLIASRVAIQHHHAHVAGCMADNGLPAEARVLGLALDGTGYGTDGAIWGGELLLTTYASFQRLAHLEYLPLPGGDAATRHPWRIAVGYATALGLPIEALPFLRGIDERAIAVTQAQVTKRLNAPLTSSMGRLFDAVAAIANVRGEVTYEAQAAIELEALSTDGADETESYPYTIEVDGVIRLGELLGAVIDDARRGENAAHIGAKFHRAVAALSCEACGRARTQTGINAVALSGGVWQNQLLLRLVLSGLRAEGFTVYTHRQTPPNDGGLALGQALIAAALNR
jgi:hydrogenase maturation protein HypF